MTAPADRKHILMTSGRCFNCLRWGHITRNCKSSSRCQKCKKKHHISICEDSQNQPPHLPPPGGSSLNQDAPPFQSSHTTSTLCSENLHSVLLQTACAVIHHPLDTRVSLPVRLILDGGSQKSYISQRACDVLNLEVVGEQSLSIATFGSSRGVTVIVRGAHHL